MKNKNTIIKVIAAVIIVVVIILINVALYLMNNGKDNNKDKVTYKQCQKLGKGMENSTNFEHNNLNYEVDKDNNRVNNSKLIPTKHDSTGDNKEGLLSVNNLKIVSKNCEEMAAHITADLINNSENGYTNLLAIFIMKDKSGKEINRFSMDIKSLKKGETYKIDFKLLIRIIDAYDYEFTFADPTEMDG